MAEPDARVADEYARHLSKVNQKNQVLATEDILNEQGVMLVKKGTPISEKLADRMIRHKLTRPLEHSVNLSNVIDAGRLQKAFADLFQRYPDCGDIHRALNLQVTLQEQCRAYATYSLLMQKFTVLSMQRPHDYLKGLFCAWFSLALARQMKLPEATLSSAFLAGLMHDTGMLHISAEILDKQGQLSADEWRAIQGHTVIGQLFLKGIQGLPGAVARATLEHHERRDGTGYPSGKFAEALDPVGEIVAIADSLCAIRMLRLAKGKGNLSQVVPILQMNCRSYNQKAYRAAVNLIRAAELESVRSVADADMSEHINGLIDVQIKLEGCYEAVAEIVPVLPEDSDNAKIKSAALIVQSSWFAVASSGLLTPSLRQWMRSIQKEQNRDYYSSMEELSTMQREVHWQLVQLRKALNLLKSVGLPKEPQSQLLLDKVLSGLAGLDTVFPKP